MIVAFSISPSGGDETGGVGAAVAQAIRVVRASGLPNETNAMFTNVEGSWDEVMGLLHDCVEAAAERASRVSVVAKLDYRPGAHDQLHAKVEAVERELRADP
ncbi:MAG TPA: thiamine-binding protein [Mycobacterium sp.]|nr:thiamine-binding protein [Mycobacterium sp.]